MPELHEQTETKMIQAGKIKRHPVTQRPSPLTRFFNKFGAYDEAKNLNPIHVVSDGNGGFLAIDGATRVEACRATKGYGDGHKLKCVAYGNGKVPPEDQLAKLFRLTNVERIAVSARIDYRQSLIAGDAAAIATEGLAEHLGTKFNAKPSLRSAIVKYGAEAVAAAVYEAESIWKGDSNGIPMRFVSAIIKINQSGQADRLRSRRASLRKSGTRELGLRAQNAVYRMTGRRPGVGEVLIKILLGYKIR